MYATSSYAVSELSYFFTNLKYYQKKNIFKRAPIFSCWNERETGRKETKDAGR
jgi:hypothetical protein